MRNQLITIALVIAFGCGPALAAPQKKKPRKLYNCTAQLQKAVQRYDKGRYADVKTILEEVRYQCSGNSMIDTVLYYLGMSSLEMKQPVEAVTEFKRLSQNYPNSVFHEETEFRIGQCSFIQSNSYERDQTETRDAIRELTDFIDTYPASVFADSAKLYLDKCIDKLAHKEYSVARFYHKSGQYSAAIVYYQSVLDGYPQSDYVPDSRLYMAVALGKISRPAEARMILTELADGSAGEAIAKKAKKALQRLDKRK